MKRNELLRDINATTNAYAWQAEMQGATVRHRNNIMNAYADDLATRFKAGLEIWKTLFEKIHDPSSLDPRNVESQMVSREIPLFGVDHP